LEQVLQPNINTGVSGFVLRLAKAALRFPKGIMKIPNILGKEIFESSSQANNLS
jgi:hypothetical protein